MTAANTEELLRLAEDVSFAFKQAVEGNLTLPEIIVSTSLLAKIAVMTIKNQQRLEDQIVKLQSPPGSLKSDLN